MLRYFIILIFMVSSSQLLGQATLVAKYTNAANRAKLYRTMVNVSITKNLSLPLNEATSEYWEDAFYTLQLLNKRSAWIDGKIIEAVNQFTYMPYSFQRQLLELLYTNYKNEFSKEVGILSYNMQNPKLFAMAMEYLMADTKDSIDRESLVKITRAKFADQTDSHPILKMLKYQLEGKASPVTTEMIYDITSATFLPESIILYSFQRKNRDYPGMAVIRNKAGKFLMTDSSTLFSVPHFARSLSSLPSYLTNGNTPQGIFRMSGFAVSSSEFIGPSVNVQMCMPVECSISKFFNDSSIIDTTWNERLYKWLLPPSWQNHFPVYEAYYAGAAGRTEIIAHGTTVDPEYYSDKPYYPHTPSLGCLTTSEIWDDNGRRIVSNQQKLVDALLRAGGANGYCVVLELPGEGPVTAHDISLLISRSAQENN